MLVGGPLLAAAPAAVEAQRALPSELQNRLVQLEKGRLAPARISPETRRVAFYFGASWCGPCRAFVPELRAAYPQLRARGIEVVFVSDDADCRRMTDYVVQSRMPWPVVGCRHRDRLAWLQRARGATLPGLLLFDVNGRQWLSSWTRSGMSRPRDALRQIQALPTSR